MTERSFINGYVQQIADTLKADTLKADTLKGCGGVRAAASRRAVRSRGLQGLGVLVLAATLSACGTTSPAPNPTYKVGSPYKIEGQWYRPSIDYSYDKVGIASWYGPGFDGNLTANGERFDPRLITAAHPTLPLPTIASVTNLENNRSIVVRINDRGPFINDRIIDLSERAAAELGFRNKGLARVRVQVLAQESIQAARALGADDRSLQLASLGYGGQPQQMAMQPMGYQPMGQSFEPTSYGSTAPIRQYTPVPAHSMTYSAPPPAYVDSVSYGSTNPVMTTPNYTQTTAMTRQSLASAMQQPSAQPLTLPLRQPAGVQSAALAAPQPLQSSQPIISTVSQSAPLAITSAPINTGYYVQAAALSDQLKAEALAQKLSYNRTALVQPVLLDGRQLYRVRVGPMQTSAQAETALSELVTSGYPQSRIVIE